MSRIKEFTDGFGNILKSKMDLISEEDKKLFDKRKKICDSCPHGQGSRCEICGCVIAAKTKSKTSSCPNKLW